MAFQETILEWLSGALSTLGESKLIEVLQQLHDKDTTAGKTHYKSVILGGWSFVTGIGTLVSSTKSKIDDAILASLKDAIQQSALANGVTLP